MKLYQYIHRKAIRQALIASEKYGANYLLNTLLCNLVLTKGIPLDEAVEIVNSFRSDNKD